MMKRTKHRAPGKAHRTGLTLYQIMDMFPNEDAATKWFEETLWPEERCCGHCGSTRTKETPNRRPMPYWCSDCRRYFSVRTGTPIAKTNLPLRKWAIAIYLELTSLKKHQQHETEPGYRRKSTGCMVHAPPDSESLEQQRKR